MPALAPKQKKKKNKPMPERAETQWDRANKFNFAVAQFAADESTKNKDRKGPNYESPVSGGLVVQTTVNKDGIAEAGNIPMGIVNSEINKDYMKQLSDANYDPAKITNPHLKSNIDALTEQEQRRVGKKPSGKTGDKSVGSQPDASVDDERSKDSKAMTEYYKTHTRNKPNHAEDTHYYKILKVNGKVEDSMFTKVFETMFYQYLL